MGNGSLGLLPNFRTLGAARVARAHDGNCMAATYAIGEGVGLFLSAIEEGRLKDGRASNCGTKTFRTKLGAVSALFGSAYGKST